MSVAIKVLYRYKPRNSTYLFKRYKRLKRPILIDDDYIYSQPSKSLESELELAAAAEAAAGLTTMTPIVSIDCSQHDGSYGEENLCKRYDINAYPSIRLFRIGDLETDQNQKRNGTGTKTRTIGTRYRGPRTASA